MARVTLASLYEIIKEKDAEILNLKAQVIKSTEEVVLEEKESSAAEIELKRIDKELRTLCLLVPGNISSILPKVKFD